MPAAAPASAQETGAPLAIVTRPIPAGTRGVRAEMLSLAPMTILEPLPGIPPNGDDDSPRPVPEADERPYPVSWGVFTLTAHAERRLSRRFGVGAQLSGGYQVLGVRGSRYRGARVEAGPLVRIYSPRRGAQSYGELSVVYFGTMPWQRSHRVRGLAARVALGLRLPGNTRRAVVLGASAMVPLVARMSFGNRRSGRTETYLPLFPGLGVFLGFDLTRNRDSSGTPAAAPGR